MTEEFRYVLNVNKGNCIQHPEIKLQGGVAYKVSVKLANQLKNIRGIVVFDKVIE